MSSTNVDFTDHTDRHRPQGLVEQMHGGVDLRHADGHRALPLATLNRISRGVHHGFGGSVEVVQQRIERSVEAIGQLAW